MRKNRGFILAYSVVIMGVIVALTVAIVAANGALGLSDKIFEERVEKRLRCDAVCEYFVCGNDDKVQELCEEYGYVAVIERRETAADLEIYESSVLIFTAKISGGRLVDSRYVQ